MTTTTTSPTATDLVPAAADVLATGWERAVAPDDSVLRNYVATLEDRLLMLARVGRGRVRRTELALLVDLGSAYVFDNIVIPNGFLTDREYEQVLTDARSFFPGDRSWTLPAFSPAVDLAAAGLSLLGHPPLMYRPAEAAPPRLPAEPEIRAVTTERDLAVFERTLSTAYPLPAGSAVLDPGVLEVGFRGWIGLVDGTPVATAGSHTAHGLTEVEWVSTLPTHRGQGIGAALAWTATTAVPDTPAVLVATDDGRPVYERLGYVPLLRLSMWLKP